MHHADAGLKRIKRILEVYFLVVDVDLAFVSAGCCNHGHAEQDVHQRGLAGAVLPHQAQYLTGHEGETDVCKDPVAEVFLPDVLHSQERYFIGHSLRPVS